MSYTIEDAMDNQEPLTWEQTKKIILDHDARMSEFVFELGDEPSYTADVVYAWLGY